MMFGEDQYTAEWPHHPDTVSCSCGWVNPRFIATKSPEEVLGELLFVALEDL